MLTFQLITTNRAVEDRQGLYYPGRRHPAWLKVKGVQEDSFLVCGYTAGEGWREGLFGALLLGKPDGRGGLRYCGSVGTGFTVAGLAEVQELVKDLHTQECPFPQGYPSKGRGTSCPAGRTSSLAICIALTSAPTCT